MLKNITLKKLGTITVRPMLLFDVPDVYKIECRAYTSPWTEKLIHDCVRVGYFCWVIEYKQKIIAYAIYRIAAEEAHLFNIAVDPKYQNKGIARAFLTFILDNMRSNKAKSVVLEVRVSNKIARRLYKDFNFKEVGMREGYYPGKGRDKDDREDGINLELIL